MTIKYPISLNEQDLKDIKEVGRYIGISDIDSVRGSIPMIIKFSIKLAINQAKYLESLIPDLNPKELEFFLSSIKILKIKKYYEQKAKKESKPL